MTTPLMILVMVCTAFTVVNETVGAPAAGSFKYPRSAAVEEFNDPLIRDILSFMKRRMLNGKTKPISVGGNTEEAKGEFVTRLIWPLNAFNDDALIQAFTNLPEEAKEQIWPVILGGVASGVAGNLDSRLLDKVFDG